MKNQIQDRTDYYQSEPVFYVQAAPVWIVPPKESIQLFSTEKQVILYHVNGTAMGWAR